MLSGYRDGKPFYLYADGTAPAKSKVAVRPIVLDGGVARHAGARRASLHASLQASHCEEQVGTRERLTGGGVAVDCSRTAKSPAAIRGGLPSGLTGGARTANWRTEGARGEDTSCWAEERRRLGVEVKAAVAQASIWQQARGLAGQPTAPSIATLRRMAAYLARRGGLEHQEDSGAVAVRLQLEDALAAIARLQGTMAEQQARIDALEGERAVRTGERSTVQWPILLRAGCSTPTSVRKLHDSFERAASPPPPAGSGAADLEVQAEQLWKEVAAAQAVLAAALPTEATAEVQETPDRSATWLEVAVGCGQLGWEAAGAESAAVEAVVEPSGDSDADGVEAAEAVPAAAEAEPELTAEAAAAVAQAAAGIEVQKSSRRGMYFEETDEEFDERMNSPGWRMETEYRELYNIFKRTTGPTETRAELAGRWSGGVWKEGKDALERRAAWLSRGGMTEPLRS